MIKPKKLAAYALVGTLLASSAFADDIRTLTATWDGSANGNSATAVATFDLDVTAINIKLNNNTGGNYYGGLSGYISNMTLTVSGASDGNGVFTDADYYGFYIQSTGPLDFSGDWVNQVNLYDFRLFASTGAPSAVNNKTLATDVLIKSQTRERQVSVTACTKGKPCFRKSWYHILNITYRKPPDVYNPLNNKGITNNKIFEEFLESC